ncbi:reprolysin-like metallopeptidase [Luteibacter sp. 3190]|uniref:reprolysin-like metallopeptidase n=1 Tax=Luteibacter sp. 3190 TaxID=2817736 RepID=UPI002865A152|nr:hypothetical protein [Luteibacter sp. 3190]MDR6937771.1 hypothetical protein [Luteibacter sp. 3190]
MTATPSRSSLACLIATLACSPVAASDVLDRFDAAIRAGFPATVVLPSPADDARGATARAGDASLTIRAPLDVDVRFPDGEPVTTFVGTWQGDPAVITRSTGHVDITVPRGDGVDVVGYSDDSEQAHQLPAAEPVGPESTVASGSGRTARADTATSATSPGKPRTAPVLEFWMFLHDDTAGTSRRHIHARYVAWWIADMQRILPAYRLRTYYLQNRPGMTDLTYGREASMWKWTLAAQEYATRGKLHYEAGRFEYKFMLVTKNAVRENTSGLAWLGGDQAMASLSGAYNVIAHEFGHTLGGVHDDSAIWWSYVWPCETNLYPRDVAVLSNCYRYTAANEDRMRAYLSRHADGPALLDPSSLSLPLVD